MTTVRCERCGVVVMLLKTEDVDSYLMTGCCERCRNGRTGFISMMENVKSEYEQKTTTVLDEFRRIGAI